MLVNRELATLALNVSTILYLVHYFPQILKNRRAECLQELSLGFHGLLFLCYITDLIYALSYPMPWQYQLVSLVGTLCLVYQHVQLSAVVKPNLENLWLYGGLLVLLLTGAIIRLTVLNHEVILQFETVSQVAALVYLLPQWLRNTRLRSARALSFYYLLLNLGCVVCDNLAAWGLSWSLPNKFGAGFRLVIIGLLLIQYGLYCRTKSWNFLNKRVDLVTRRKT